MAVVKGQGAPLYDSNGGDLRVARQLAKNSAWRVFGQATYAGQTYYKVSNTGWVAASTVNRTGSGNVATVKPVATVNSATGLMSGDPAGNLTNSGRSLAKGTRWAVLDARKDSSGAVWYNVGGWIKAADTRLGGIVGITNNANPVQPADSTPVATMVVSGQGYGMTADKHVYQTGNALNKGSRWKVLVVAKDPQGVQWYLIGNNVWINSNQATVVNADKARQENYAWPSDNNGGNTDNGGTTNPDTGNKTDPPVSQKVDASKYSDAEYRRLVNRQIASLDLNQVNTNFMALVDARRAKDGLAPYQNDPRAQKLAQKLAELDTVGQFWTEKEWKQWATDLGFKNVRHVSTGIGSYSGQFTQYNWGTHNP